MTHKKIDVLFSIAFLIIILLMIGSNIIARKQHIRDVKNYNATHKVKLQIPNNYFK